jgi:uncharacterized repeat protein (TIGR01451 family)
MADASSSEQCTQTCTGGSFLNILSFGLFGQAATCTLSCGGESSSEAESSEAASAAPVGTCCPDPEDPSGSCRQVPESQCNTTDPFYTETWNAVPNACASCPKKASAASSSKPTQVCCIYDRESAIQGTWEVLGCELRPKDSSVICTDVMTESTKTGEWREDIPEAQCTEENAASVCGKGEIDLKLTKTYDGPSQPEVGENVSFTLDVTYASGTDTAVGVTINDFSNPNLEFVGAEGATCTVMQISGSVSCDLGNMSPGASQTVTLTYKLLDRGSSSCTVTNSALAYAVNKDEKLSNNYANAPFNAYCWNGSSASAVAASSAHPNVCCAYLGGLAQPPTKCQPVPDEEACTALIGSKVTQSLFVYTVQDVHYVPNNQCTVDCASYFATKACCTANDGCKKKRVSACIEEGGTPSDSDSCSANVCQGSSSAESASSEAQSSSKGPSTDISIAKKETTVPPGPKKPREPGSTVRYEITVTNHGGEDASDVKVSDTFPGYLTIVSMPSNCVNVSSLIVCSDISIPAGKSETITITSTVAQPPSTCTSTYPVLANRASVSAPAAFDKDSSNNIAEVPGFDVQCPTWDVKKDIMTAGTTFKRGETVTFKLTFTRKWAAYTGTNSLGDKDYFTDVMGRMVIGTVTGGTNCSVYSDGKQLQCDLPPTSKDGTVTVTVTGVIPQDACLSGDTGKKWGNTVRVNRGRGLTPASDTDIASDNKFGDVDCAAPVTTYCCSESGNACIEKGDGSSCKEGGQIYNATPINCGGACQNQKRYCCTTGKQCAEKGAPGVTCGLDSEFLSDGCNGSCPKAPDTYCCSDNECSKVTSGMTCDDGSVPQSDPSCADHLGKSTCTAPPTAYCCPADANSCGAQKVQLVDGKCPSPKQGTAQAGYAGVAACDAACAVTGGWTVDVSGPAAGVKPGSKASFRVSVKRTGAKHDSTVSSASLALVPDFLDDVTVSMDCAGGGANGSRTCALPTLNKDQTLNVTVTGTVNANVCAPTTGGRANLVATVEGETDSAPTAVACDSPNVWCCANKGGDTFGCSPRAKDDGCGIDRATGSKVDGYATQADCEAFPACTPAGDTGGDGGETGDTGGGDDMTPGGVIGTSGGDGGLSTGGEIATTGGGGGSSARASAGTSASRSSAAPVPRTCGPCSGDNQYACENGAHLCSWQPSTFGFIMVLFGGSAGNCSPVPACGGGGTSAASHSASFSSSSVPTYCCSGPEGDKECVSIKGATCDSGTLTKDPQCAGKCAPPASSSARSSSSSSSFRPSIARFVWILGLQAQAQCGDFVVEDGEECEPSNASRGRSCTASCTWSACSDGKDNDGDGYVDRDDGGCYASGKVASLSGGGFASFVGQLLFRSTSAFDPARDSEECPAGMTNGTGGSCEPLPQCPGESTVKDADALYLYCTNACGESKTPTQCAAACRCNCAPYGGADDAAASSACVSVCLSAGGSPAACSSQCVQRTCGGL